MKISKLTIEFIKTKYILLLIVLLGLFLRLNRHEQLFQYSHDTDLIGWIIRDVLENKHLRLIGQETSVQGVFIGGLFYYLLIPFYLLFKFDPIGGVYLVALIGIATIVSFYFVFTKVFNKEVGLLASLIYSVSFYTVFTDREVVPTTLVMLWSVWFFYSLNLIIQGNQKWGFLLSFFLISLIWHINLGLLILVPLIVVSLAVSKKKLNLKHFGRALGSGFLTSLPLIAFELLHGFQQTKAVVASLTIGEGEFAGGISKFSRLVFLVSKNLTGLLWGSFVGINQRYALYILLIAFLILFLKKLIRLGIAKLFSFWLLTYFLFFSLNAIILSEYYLNGMTVVWIGIVALTLHFLLQNKRLNILGFYLLTFFILINLYRFFTLSVNESGYVERKAIVASIRQDAKARGYPCVAVSYITNPGYNLGYRYLYWLEKMHVNNPESGSPVYTIVFPHTRVERIDRSFGALGLVLPDYARYTQEGVKQSCGGANSNLTDPMFGFTK